MAPPFHSPPPFAFSMVSHHVIAVWRRPSRNAAHVPLVLVLHGRGADEHDLLPVIERLPATLAYASLRAFVDAEGGGFTWFENRGVARPIAKSLRASVAALRSWLDEAAPPAAGRPCYLVGFSAGMMMAGALLLNDPQRFAGAVLLSGALALDSGIAAEPGRLRDIPIFYGRGSRDDVIPGDLVRRSEVYLRERSGAALTVREYAHAHTISLAEIGDVAAWLAERAS
jgi:phospholipase/carboxylesterase